jgi:hypothetical protein
MFLKIGPEKLKQEKTQRKSFLEIKTFTHVLTLHRAKSLLEEVEKNDLMEKLT